MKEFVPRYERAFGEAGDLSKYEDRLRRFIYRCDGDVHPDLYLAVMQELGRIRTYISLSSFMNGGQNE